MLARAPLAVLALLPFVACSSSSSSPGTDAGRDTGASSSSGGTDGGPGADATPDGGSDPQVVEACTAADYEDDTAKTTVAVTPWDTSLAKKCIKVKVGGSVSWAASTFHPLVATDGTTPTPIPTTDVTTAQSVTFPSAGVYGYHCAVHLGLMHGAIWVVP